VVEFAFGDEASEDLHCLLDGVLQVLACTLEQVEPLGATQLLDDAVDAAAQVFRAVRMAKASEISMC